MESVNLKALTKTEIFARATEEEVSSMLNCLSAKKKKYQKDEIIFHAGDIVSSIGVMLKGNALIENDDIWGNRSVLDYVKEGQIFAETYACQVYGNDSKYASAINVMTTLLSIITMPLMVLLYQTVM